MKFFPKFDFYNFLKNSFFYCCLLFSTFIAVAAVEPVEGIKPSGTLPVMYINTENSTPVDQKETYINAEFWIDCYGIDGFESVGSKEKPQTLGIRGRGNTSWRHDGQKPYKIKLDKKTELLGMPKNKHWALLARLTDHHLFNEVLGYELGRKLDMPFVPQLQPVEVVLNNTYIGLYMLSETVRIDDNRLEIAEQPDMNEDLSTIQDGWLVEMDNNIDPFQVKIPQPQGYNLLITHHTPEVTNKMQDEWLIDQFSQITESINSDNPFENRWEELVDMESLAKHLIVQECLQNFDGYLGSCYIHKDVGGKWCFGPLWDLSASWVYKTEMLAEREEQHLIGEFFKFPAFRKVARRIWNEYMQNIGNDWVAPFLSDFRDKIKAGLEQSVKVWPDTQLDADKGSEWMQRTFTHNSNFNNTYFNENCVTFDVNFIFRDLDTGDSFENAHSLFDIKINDISRNSAVVSKGNPINIKIQAVGDKFITKCEVNDQTMNFPFSSIAEIELENISEDLTITIDITGYNEVEEITAIPQYVMLFVYTLDGRLVMQTKDRDSLNSLPEGIYVVNGKKVLIHK